MTVIGQVTELAVFYDAEKRLNFFVIIEIDAIPIRGNDDLALLVDTTPDPVFLDRNQPVNSLPMGVVVFLISSHWSWLKRFPW